LGLAKPLKGDKNDEYSSEEENDATKREGAKC